LGSTSAEVFRLIASGGRPSQQQIEALLSDEPANLFGDLIEPMADSFDSSLIPAYIDVFSRLIERMLPEQRGLADRYQTLRVSRPGFEPRRVVVLSRVTLGADVAITSTLLDAARRRWPHARILLAGSRKNHALFQGIGLIETPYQRSGTLAQRLAAGLQLAAELVGEDTLVIDPDSRLSQLGLLPLAPVERTLFFESRGAGSGTESLVHLTKQFARETLGVDAAPWFDVQQTAGDFDVTVSFGVGENLKKRIGDAFEADLIRGLVSRGARVLLDSGAPGTDEAERAARYESYGIALWRGSFDAFAGSIARSRIYIGYDSAGQHVAAAAGIPRITVFAGYPNQRFLDRWRPDGPGPSVIVCDQPGVLDALWSALDSL
jgi:hypothetical protein